MAACGSIIIILIFLFLVLVLWNESYQEKQFKKEYSPKPILEPFDYAAAESRLKELQELYWRCDQIADPEGTWDWHLLNLIDTSIEEIHTAKRQPGQVANA